MQHPPAAEPSAMADQPPGLLTVTQAARWLGLGKSKLYDLMDGGKLAYFRFGRARRLSIADLEAFAATCRVGPAPHYQCVAAAQTLTRQESVTACCQSVASGRAAR